MINPDYCFAETGNLKTKIGRTLDGKNIQLNEYRQTFIKLSVVSIFVSLSGVEGIIKYYFQINDNKSCFDSAQHDKKFILAKVC
jgi:hypothetical protein